MVKVVDLKLGTNGVFVQFFPEEGVDLDDLVRLAQIFVRKHGETGGNASLPDGVDGEQNSFAIHKIDLSSSRSVTITTKCEGPERRRALIENLERAFPRNHRWV